VKIKGQEELNRKLKNMSEVVEREATQEALYAAATVVHGQAVSLCPVDLGNLKASLAFEVGDTEAEIGTPVEYAPYVEMGTSRQAAQPYLRPALDENTGKITKLFSDIYVKYIRGVT